ncbi:unnamed protein product [Symbiodinium sp. CCMP2592]|nr:unnamed protein product [Symbiodinium sp. CCMP2592]
MRQHLAELQVQQAAAEPAVSQLERARAASVVSCRHSAEARRNPLQFGLSSVLCERGTPVQRALGASLQAIVQTPAQWQATLEDICDPSRSTQPLDLILNGAGLACSATALANITGRGGQQAQRSLIQAGSATVESSALLLGSMFETLNSGQSPLEPFMLILKYKYDETPTKVRVATVSATHESDSHALQHLIVPKSCVKGPELQHFLKTQGQLGQGRTMQSATHAKILQTHVSVIALYKVKQQQQHFAVVQSAFPCSLQAMDRATGETQRRAVWETFSSIPEMTRLLAAFPLCVRQSTTDRYTANFRTEAGLGAWLPGVLLCHLGCDAHKAATTIKNCLKPAQADVSGVLNTGLMLMSDLAVVKKLRDIFIAVLCAELQVHSSAGPENAAECQRYRRECFEMFLPTEGAMRWIAVLESQHKLFTKLLSTYLGKPSVQPVHQDSETHAPGQDAWSDVIQDVVGAGPAPAGQGAAAAAAASSNLSGNRPDAAGSDEVVDAASAFALENARRRASVQEYVLSDPLPRLCIMQQVLQPTHDFTTEMLGRSSAAWEQKQAGLAAVGKERTYVILEDAKGEAVATTMVRLLDVLHQDARGFLGPVACALRALKFCMCSATMCSMHSLIRLCHQALPYQMFRLLDDPAAADRLLDLPPCMLDQVFSELKQKYPEPDLLLGAEAISIVKTLAWAASTNIADLEASHNSTRDFSAIRSRGWTCSLESVSARHVLQQKLRLLGATHTRGRRTFIAASLKRCMKILRCKLPSASGKKSKPRRGGGGAWRAFVSFHAHGKKLTATLASHLSQLYRNLDDEEKAWFAEAGAAGTRAHADGHKAFGERAPVQSLPGEASRVNPDAVVARDVERQGDFSLVTLPGSSFSERYEEFKQSLPSKPAHETDALALTKAESEAVQKVATDLAKLPAKDFLDSEGHAELLSGFEGLPSHSGAHRQDSAPTVFFNWLAPTDKVVQATLRDDPAATATRRRYGLSAALTRSWTRRCRVLLHAEQKPILPADLEDVFKEKPCLKYGLCVCGQSDVSVPDALHCFNNVKRWMQPVFAKVRKVSPKARVLMDGHLVVFCFAAGPAWGIEEGDDVERSTFDKQEPKCEVHFLHIGHVNYSSWHFTAAELSDDLERLGVYGLIAEADEAGTLQLGMLPSAEAGPSLGVMTDLQFFRDLDLSLAWMLSAYAISLDEDDWQHWDTSCKVVPIKAVEPSTIPSCWVWRGSDFEKHHRKVRQERGTKRSANTDAASSRGSKPSKRTARDPPKPADNTRDGDIDDALDVLLEAEVQAGEGGRAQGPDVPMEFDPYGWFDRDDPKEVDEQGAHEPGPDVRQTAAGTDESEEYQHWLKQIEDAYLEDYSPSYAGSDAEFDWDGLLAEDSKDAADRAAEPPAEAAEPNPDLDGLPDELPGAAAGAARAPAARDRHEDFDKTEVEVPGYGRLRYYKHREQKQIIAVCGFHKDCRVMRSLTRNPNAKQPDTALFGQGRPLGLVIAWLKCQHEHTSQQEHIHSFHVDFQARQDARVWFLENVEDAADWAGLEREQADGEGEALVDYVKQHHEPLKLASLMLEESSPLFREHFDAFVQESTTLTAQCQLRGISFRAEEMPFEKKWQTQSRKLRVAAGKPGLAVTAKPWTSLPDIKLDGISHNARVKEVLDLAVLQYLGRTGCSDGSEGGVRKKCQDLYTDVSQNPNRKSFTAASGSSRCLTTSSTIYSHGRDRVVLPLEMLFFQGHTVDVKIPDGMKQRSLRSLAGEGICLPCLATLLFALHCTDSLDV